jgi:hypothetical protein
MKTAVKSFVAGAAGMIGALGVLAFVGHWASSAMRRDIRATLDIIRDPETGYSDPVDPPAQQFGDVDA